MINIIFGIFLISGIIYSFFSGNTTAINNSLINSGKTAIDIIINMIPLLCLWLGVMKIAENSGLLRKIAKMISKLLLPLFPELKKEDSALAYIASNITMNIFGLGNAATPFGLKAFEELQKKNETKEKATRSMITLLVINTASVTLIPTTVISFRTLNHSQNPQEIIFPCIIATAISCLIGLIADRILANIYK